MDLSSFVRGHYPVSVPSVDPALSTNLPAEEYVSLSSGLSTNGNSCDSTAGLGVAIVTCANRYTRCEKGYLDHSPDPG
jgi:hypothetical protein